MRRFRKIALWTLGVVIGLPVALVLLVVIAGNLPPVQRLAERQAVSLTGGMVKIAGLHGRFPDLLRLDHAEVADANGTWLMADGVALDWSPTSLLVMQLRIDSASVDHVAVLRKPMPAKAAPAPASKGGFNLPVSVDLRALRVARVNIAAPVTGPAFALRLDGTAQLRNLQDGQADLTATRLDSPGTYHVDGVLHQQTIGGHVTIQEPSGGLIAAIGKLQNLGAIEVTAAIDGPKTAERATLRAAVGDLHATLDGTADLPGSTMALDVTATAPMMHLRHDLFWDSIDLKAHVAGPFTTPDATGHLAVANLSAAGAGVQQIAADLAGNQGSARLRAVLTGLKIPGSKPDLFAAAPVKMQADIDLASPARPVNLHVSHPLLTADMTAQTGGAISATLHAMLPDLAPFAAAGGADVQGTADLSATVTTSGTVHDVAAHGIATVDGGATPPTGLRGDTKFDVAATLDGGTVTLHHATIDGANVHLDAAGTRSAETMSMQFHAGVPRLAAFAPRAEGAVTATGTVSGPPQDLAVLATVKGDAGTAKFGHGPILIGLDAKHLPASPDAKVNAKIFAAGANAVIAAEATTDGSGTIHAVIDHADWKSFRICGDVTRPKDGAPAGKMDVLAGNLGDLAALTGQALGGSLHAVLTTRAADSTVTLDGRNLAAGTRRIASLALKGRATGAPSDPDIDGTLTLAGIDADGITGGARVTAQGRPAAVRLRATADLQNVRGAPANLDTTALLNATAKQATLQALTANWKTLALRLQGPSRIEFGQRIAVDRLLLAVNGAILEAAGQFGPTLNFTASARNLTPDLARAVAPALNAAGTLNADARITGTNAAPSGTIRLSAAGLHMRTGPAASVPPAIVSANVQLAGGTARLDAHIDAGPKLHLAASGTAPIRSGGQIAVRATGALDLTIANPILQAGGRQAKGRATLDLTATGTQGAPRLSGRIVLAGADIQDFAQGLHLDRINGSIDATGDTLLPHLSLGAGPGTIQLSGSVGFAQQGLPVDLRITARNARPLASDLITANFDADLTVRGQAQGTLDAGGAVTIHHMDINIPEGLPPSVATLNVRRPGTRPPPTSTGPSAPPAMVRLAIDVDAPQGIFVRGKGLFAELGGKLQLRGTSTAPLVEGGFDMRRGDFSLVGTTLTFAKGSISFNGVGVAGRIDPTLDFEADSYSGSITAILKVTGYASAPKIALSSTPDLPQDEVLAHLLFGQSMSQLSALQIAEIGAALAQLSGAVGGGEGPLGSLRKGLGLDRLSVGGGGSGSTPTVEAGRYVAKGVYVGTKQSAGSGGTQVEVQVDITRRLKLTSTLGSGGGTAQGATPQTDPGTTIGLSYGFEY